MMDQSRVVMFPGLGASYPRMIEKYLAAHPDDAEFVQRWAKLCGLEGSTAMPASCIESRRQFAIHLMNLLWWRRTPEAQRDAAVCGHSLGYYAALVAAGVITEAESFTLLEAVFDAAWPRFCGNDKLIYVLTTRTEVPVAQLTGDLPIEVVSDNNPLQRALYGDSASCEALFARLGANVLRAVALGTKVPFHSAQMQEVLASVTAKVADLGVCPRPLQRQVWSHITGRPLANAAEAFALVIEQLCRPVRWNLLVDRLIQAGRYDFFEVGPNRVLSQIVRWISPDLGVQFADNLRR